MPDTGASRRVVFLQTGPIDAIIHPKETAVFRLRAGACPTKGVIKIMNICKRILCLFLASVMILSFFPVSPIHAADEAHEETAPLKTGTVHERSSPLPAYAESAVYVNGVSMADGTYLASGATFTTTRPPQSGYAYYQDGTLTLNDYANSGGAYPYLQDSYGISGATVYAPGDLNIVLTPGTDNILTNEMGSEHDYCDGIYAEGQLTVTGDGSLSVSASDYAVYAENVTAELASFTSSGYIYVPESGTLSMDLTGSFTADCDVQAGIIRIRAGGDITVEGDGYANVETTAEFGPSSLISENGRVTVRSGSWALYPAHEMTVSAADTIWLEAAEYNAISGYNGDLTLTAPNGITVINGPDTTSDIYGTLTARASAGDITLVGSLYADAFDLQAKGDVTLTGGYIECTSDTGESSILSETGNVTLTGETTALYVYGDLDITAAEKIAIRAEVPEYDYSTLMTGSGSLTLHASEAIELTTNSGYLSSVYCGFAATVTDGTFTGEGSISADRVNICAKEDVTLTNGYIYTYEDCEPSSIVSEEGDVVLTGTYDTLSPGSDMTVSAGKQIRILCTDSYGIYAGSGCNLTLTAAEGIDLDSACGTYISKSMTATVTDGSFRSIGDYHLEELTIQASGDITLENCTLVQNSEGEHVSIASTKGAILISAPEEAEALYGGSYHFQSQTGTTVTSGQSATLYDVGSVTAQGPLKIVNTGGGNVLTDDVKITGEEVTLIGSPAGTANTIISYENRNGEAYAVYEGDSEAALKASDHESAGEIYSGYLDSNAVRFVEEAAVSTQAVKKLELELEGYAANSPAASITVKLTATGAYLRPGGYGRSVFLLYKEKGEFYELPTDGTLSADTKYWIGIQILEADGYSLKDITASDITLKGYTNLSPQISYDTATESLILLYSLPKPGVPVCVHDYDYLNGTVTVEPGCETEGEMTYTCKKGCGIPETETVEPLGHAYDSGTVTRYPTCTETGIRHFTCQRSSCSHSRREEIPALGLAQFQGIAPDITESEFAARTADMGSTSDPSQFEAAYIMPEDLVTAGCSARIRTTVYLDGSEDPCETSYDGYTPDALGEYRIVHELLITEPGKAEAVHDTFTHYVTVTGLGNTLGDLNLDGNIDSDDLTLLARHVAGIETVSGQALKNADVNNDTLVNSDDLTRHARYVAGIITDWDQE